MVEVRVPEAMRRYCGEQRQVVVSGSTVEAALSELREATPELYNCICDETDRVRRHIHVFVNSDLISTDDPRGLNVVLKTGDVLTIWTAVSGG